MDDATLKAFRVGIDTWIFQNRDLNGTFRLKLRFQIQSPRKRDKLLCFIAP